MVREVQTFGTANFENLDAWVYPELHVGFGMAYYEPGAHPDELVEDAMMFLDHIAEFTLPYLCPDGFPLQPGYSYNENKLRMVSHYLNQTFIDQQTYQPLLKGDVVDVPAAVVGVIDKLAESNHPVSQLIAQMYSEYGQKVSADTLEYVSIQIIKLTHWSKLRGLLAAQIASYAHK
jgi:hypothetical protein